MSKQIRRSFSIKDKQKILKRLKESNLSITQFAIQNNISIDTLKRMSAKKKLILAIEEKTNRKKIGSGRKTIIPSETEKKIMEWFCSYRKQGLPINDNILKIKIKHFMEKDKVNYECNFSNGFLTNFKKEII